MQNFSTDVKQSGCAVVAYLVEAIEETNWRRSQVLMTSDRWFGQENAERKTSEIEIFVWNSTWEQFCGSTF